MLLNKSTDNRVISTNNHNTHRLEKLTSKLHLSILSIAVCYFAATTSVEAATCRFNSSQTLVSAPNSVRLLHVKTGSIVDLQRIFQRFTSTARAWVNGQYAGDHNIPLRIDGLLVTYENKQVFRTGIDGKVKLVFKQIPVVKTCRNWRIF